MLEIMEGIVLLAMNQMVVGSAGGGGESKVLVARFLKEEPGVGRLHRVFFAGFL